MESDASSPKPLSERDDVRRLRRSLAECSLQERVDAQHYVAEAFKEVARLATDAKSEYVRVLAIRELLAQVLGKPAPPSPGDEENPLAAMLAAARETLRAKLERREQSQKSQNSAG